MHPLAVAQIACGEIGLGSTSICAALLHDVVEDTDYTVEDISNIFGPKIAQIVDGLTKISGGIFGEQASAQAESFKKLLLTMSDDIRVILIKISDRLHNMRTLGSQPAHKRYKIAGETLYIYAPLAHRLGLNIIKEELEDLSFKYEHPETYEQIVEQLKAIEPHLNEVFNEFTSPIQKGLDKMGVTYEIKARIKRPFSVWMKMQNKHISFEEIYDILAVRIIFDPKTSDSEINDCLQIYGICTSFYDQHPTRFRDWLHHPKANGYQALHTTLMSKQGRWIELQIRSRRMDDMAERGFAAHWKYKEGMKDATASETELDKWLATIKEILDDPQPSAMDFLDTIKLNLYASEIFVVTPKGEFKTMPSGCTALDFAFSIHTMLGTHCMGAKVNHQLVPISHKLESGDQVEIIAGNDIRVQPSWLPFATTAKAKNKIEAVLRRQRREKAKKGEEMLSEWLNVNDAGAVSITVDRLMALYKKENREALFVAVGDGDIELSDDLMEAVRRRTQKNTKSDNGWKRYIPFLKTKPTESDSGPEEVEIDKKHPIIITEDNIHKFVLCPLCHPIPGDDILGYLDEHKHLIIHKRQCSDANRLKTAHGNRIVAVFWDTHKHNKITFPATIHIEGIDRMGILRSLTDVLTQQLNVNVRHITIDTDNGIFQGEIELEVRDTQDVTTIIKNLKKIDGLQDVMRVS